MWVTVLDWFKTLLVGFAGASHWLFDTTITIDGIDFSPALLFTFTGISVYVIVAVAMWFAK